MIKGVVFDLDDTLLKTKQSKYQVFRETGKRYYNLDIHDEVLDAHWGLPFRVLVGNVFGDVDDLDRIVTRYMSTVQEFHNEPYDDALDVVKALSEDYPLAIVSSASRELVMRDLLDCGFDPEIFTFIQTEDDTSVHKPNPEVFRPLLNAFAERGIRPEELLFTGDGLHDFHASIGAGLQFVGIADRTVTKSEFDRAGAISVANLSELQQYIARNNVRHMVESRTMCFVFSGDNVLLMKASDEKDYSGTYDPLGGHIEKGEDILSCAVREIREEAGLKVQHTKLCGVMHVTNFFGKDIMLFVTASKVRSKKTPPAHHEGIPVWVPISKLNTIKVFDDLQPIMDSVMNQVPFTGVSRFDDAGKLLELSIHSYI